MKLPCLRIFRPGRVRLRTLLFSVNLLVLLLPLAAIGFFQLYENELVRQTESALIGQAAILANLFAGEITAAAKGADQDSVAAGKVLPAHSMFRQEEGLTPIQPRLDLFKSPVSMSALPGAVTGKQPFAPAAEAAGRLVGLINDTKKITLCGIRLVDYQGIVVASSGSEQGLLLTNRPEVRAALAGHYASLLRERVSDEPAPSFSSLSRRGWVRVFVAMPVICQNRVAGAVILSRSPLDLGKRLYLIRGHLLKVGVGLLVLVLVVSVVTTMAIERPIQALIRQAEMVKQGNRAAAVVLDRPVTKEVEHLSEAISSMASALQDRADYIQTFARNVSHEFKTPLTAIRGALELLEDHRQTMSDEEQERFLANMTRDVRYLERLVHRLLELARADVCAPGEACCAAGAVLQEIVDRYRARGVTISFRETAPLPQVRIEREVLATMVTNLIENSLQHGGKNVSVTLEARPSELPDYALEIEVTDTGRGISEANRAKIFRPFFTTARDTGGSGLGLTIVQKLLLAHGGSVEYVPQSRGARFRLLLR